MNDNMTPYELESIESKLDLSDPFTVLIFLLILSFAQFDNEIVFLDGALYEKISDGHYRKVSVTLDQIKSHFLHLL